MIHFETFCYTHPGGRENNEDRAEACVDDDCALLVLADGLGGHNGGEQASELVAASILRDYHAWLTEPAADLQAWLNQSILKANADLIKQQTGYVRNMKTTLAVFISQGAQVHWAHVGDSRIYLVHEGEIFRLTDDHSLTFRKYLSHEITEDQIPRDEDRSYLLRVMGDETRCEPGFGTLGDFGITALSTNDAILLCTDGFWEYLSETEILIDALKSASPQEWVESMLLRALPRFSPEHDNLTALAAFVRVDDAHMPGSPGEEEL